MSVNKVILIGHVGKDPEVRYLESNTPVCKMSLATSEVYKNKAGERVTTTEWHNVVLWRGLAEVAEKYVKKGTQVYIEGRIHTRSWDDKDKNKHYTTEIVADVLQLLGKRTEETVAPNPPTSLNDQPSPENSPITGKEDEDGLPF
jgi:single-strand DNA-binding protein